MSRGGYYNRGIWIPHVYAYPYPFYFNRFGSYRSPGASPVVGGSGAPVVASPSAPAAPSGAAAPGVARGGFGATAHGGGSGE